MKISIIDLVPPIAIKTIAYIGRKIRHESLLPKWGKVQQGHLKGTYLFINNQMQGFKDMLTGTYDNFFWDYIKNRTFLDTLILDIGGHIGYHSLGFSKLVGEQGRVITFEPNLFNVERMKLIFSKNDALARRIEILPIAVSNKEEEVNFQFSSNIDNMTSSGGFIENSYTPEEENVYRNIGFKTQKVKSKTIDFIIKENAYQNVSLIKIDVEGAEHMVLEGAVETIKKFQPLLLVEIHSVLSMFYVSELLFMLNYKIKILNEDTTSRCFIAADYNSQK